MIRLLTLPAGFILDLLMGDPRWLYHPVCLIGNLISILEKGIRKVFPKTDKGERVGGILEVVLVCFITFFIPYVVIHLFYKWKFWLEYNSPHRQVWLHIFQNTDIYRFYIQA